MNENIKIIVVTHKNYTMPKDSMYIPVCVGEGKQELRRKFYSDDTGENISEKNSQYSELTALYWAWKNLSCSYLGIAHYRRYLTKRRRARSLEDILSAEEALELLRRYDVLVPKKNWYPETISKHFIYCKKDVQVVHSHYLEIVRDTIQKQFPDYVRQYDAVLKGHRAHMYNMFVMKKEDLDQYCKWLFSILFTVEKEIKGTFSDQRIMGGLSEFMLDTWLLTNKKKIKELYLFQTEMSFTKHLIRAIKKRFFGVVG